MDRFIVSARKYRPQTFDTVVGQEHITTTLRNAIKHQQLAHAFLFCGPRGVGKTTCARILAKTINCEKPTPEGEACDSCQSCQSFQEGASINYFELDAASNNSVEDIRTLTEQVRFAPQGGRYKVYVIDEVHMLSTAAFNAFLKTLEEPPPYAIFILATTEKHKILPTILSRCQIFDFKRITTQDTVGHLQSICQKEKINAEKAALQIIAQKSEGCMRDALSILDKIVSFTNGELDYTHTLEHLNILDEDHYFKFLSMMHQQDLSGAMLLYDEINRKGFEGDLVLNGLSEFFRNLLVCQDEKAASLLDTVESFREKYLAAAAGIKAEFLISALNILTEAEINYRSARNKKLHVEMALIRLCYLQQAISLATGEQGLIKKKMTDGAVAFRTALIQRYTVNSTTASSPSQPLPPTKSIPKETGARLVIETTEEKKQPEKTTAQATTTPKLNALTKIREQFKTNTNAAIEAVNKELEQNSLQLAWLAYAQLLKEAKNPAAQPIEAANLRVVDANSFEVVTHNNIEQRFIEQERNPLFQFLQHKLDNRVLQFSVLVEEQPATMPSSEVMLSVKEQYQELVKRYPIIQELKERLRLELDY